MGHHVEVTVGAAAPASPEGLDRHVREMLVASTTARVVEVAEIRPPGSESGRELVEPDAWEQIDGVVWLVVGIYEPSAPDAPWLVVHARRLGERVVVRHPPREVAQHDVLRVHDARVTDVLRPVSPTA